MWPELWQGILYTSNLYIILLVCKHSADIFFSQKMHTCIRFFFTKPITPGSMWYYWSCTIYDKNFEWEKLVVFIIFHSITILFLEIIKQPNLLSQSFLPYMVFCWRDKNSWLTEIPTMLQYINDFRINNSHFSIWHNWCAHLFQY